MKYQIDEDRFRYVENALKRREDREGYFKLAKTVFQLDFAPWFESGYCGDRFIPYALYDGDVAIASVGVATSEFKWQNQIRSFAQVSTVMTARGFRGMDLNGWLMERVLDEWKNKSDFIYLYANDDVLDYYPRFGFQKTAEYTYSIPVLKKIGKYRKIDLSIPGDITLLTEKYRSCNNPYSALTMENNLSQLMFHCLTFLRDNIYYIEQFDAIVIAECENDSIFCYDIYTDATCTLSEIIGVLAAEDTVPVVLGFTPHSRSGNFKCEQSVEQNTTVFTFAAKDTIFHTHKVTLPFLSRA